VHSQDLSFRIVVELGLPGRLNHSERDLHEGSAERRQRRQGRAATRERSWPSIALPATGLIGHRLVAFGPVARGELTDQRWRGANPFADMPVGCALIVEPAGERSVPDGRS
jgi:hypothetical protein